MASAYQLKNGNWRVQFTHPDGSGKRPIVDLGPVNKRVAGSMKNLIGDLVTAIKIGGPVDASITERVERLGDVARDKLVEVGLLKPRVRATLKGFLDDYIDSRANLKPNTLRNYRITEKHLLDYFGPDRDMTTITPGDAEDWREGLFRQGKAAGMVNREVTRAKQYFEAAVRRELIRRSPFVDLKGGKQENRNRFRFVSIDEARKILDACPDAEWRLIFALARFGGLRVPSEIKGLRWGDINWEQGTFIVHSPKTEHHSGKESRVVPIFPELVSVRKRVIS